jgi:hypothetical protein
MTWTQRLEAVGVLAVAAAGLLAAAATVFGLVPVTAPQLAATLMALVAAAKAGAIVWALAGYVTRRIMVGTENA